MKYLLIGSLIFIIEIGLGANTFSFLPVLGGGESALVFGISAILYALLGYNTFFEEKQKAVGVLFFLLAFLSGAWAFLILTVMSAWSSG